MTITMAAPASCAARLRSAHRRELKWVVVTITGTRPAMCSSAVCIRVLRSSSLSTNCSEKFASMQMPSEPASIMKSRQRRWPSRSSSPRSVKMVGATGNTPRLAIGAIMGAIPECVVPALNQLHAGQPNLSVEVVEDTSARMLQQLDDGRLDLVIGRAAVAADPSKYHYRPLGDEPLSVVVGYGHPPLPKKEVKLRDLAGHRWVMYPSHMPLHALLEREMDLAGLEMPDNPVSTASTFVTVALLQSSHNLVSLLPTAIAALFVRQKMLRLVPVKLKSPSQTFGVVTRKGGVLSPPAEQFIELLRTQPAQARLPAHAARKQKTA
jgi:DNA-binding transcriptional LysR family regulator